VERKKKILCNIQKKHISDNGISNKTVSKVKLETKGAFFFLIQEIPEGV